MTLSYHRQARSICPTLTKSAPDWRMEQAGCALRFRSASRALRFGVGVTDLFHAEARRRREIGGDPNPHIHLYFLRKARASRFEMRSAHALLRVFAPLREPKIRRSPHTPAPPLNPQKLHPTHPLPVYFVTLSPVGAAFHAPLTGPHSPSYSNPAPGQSRLARHPQRAGLRPKGARR